MGTAVERLEIWTAFALLLVALFVGAAGTLAWPSDAPEPAGQTQVGYPAVADDVLSRFASTAARWGKVLVEHADSTARLALEALGRLPGGAPGAVAAIVAGCLGMPMLAAAAKGLQLAGPAAGKLYNRIQHTSQDALRAGARRYRRTAPGSEASRSAEQHRPDGAVIAAQQATAPGEDVVNGPNDGEACKPEQLRPLHTTRALPEHQVAAAPPLATLLATVRDEPQPALPAPGLAETKRPTKLAGAASRRPAPQLYEEDRALAALEEAQALIAACGANSSVLAIDTAHDQARVLLDLQPDDEARLDRAFASRLITTPRAQLRWLPPALQVRFSDGAGVVSATSAMLIPLLSLGRRGTRYVPLAGWRHLGIYGAGAHAAAHHLIAALLCQQRPDQLGLAVLDRHGWASLYRNTPHWVDTPGDGPATADALARALRRGAAVATRPIVVVAIDPDGATLSAFAALLSRLSLQPAAPVHFVLVQQHLHPLGRRLYLGLPALVTAGSAAPELLPAVRQWPRHGNAVVLIRGRRWSGQPLESDETGAAELARRLAPFPRSAAPVLWQVTEPPPSALPDRPDPLLESAAVGTTGS